MIADYDGTVLIVSHDRDFLDRTVTDHPRARRLGQGRHRRGRLRGLAEEADAAPQRPGRRARSRSPHRQRPPRPPRRDGTKLTYKDQRDYDLLPQRIEELEAQIARDEEALHDPDLYARDPKRFAALTAAIEKARAERDAAEERWLELAEQVEALA